MATKTIIHKNNSIFSEAMEVLMKHLGPEKTAALWRVLYPPSENYVDIRKKLFAGKDTKTIFREAARFNRSGKNMNVLDRKIKKFNRGK